MQISVFGLGKLGSPLAAVLASKGHQVIGVDVNPGFVRALAAGKAPVAEPGLQAIIDASKDRLTATSDYERAVLASELSFSIVPTPSDAPPRRSSSTSSATSRVPGSWGRRRASCCRKCSTRRSARNWCPVRRR
jgi:UDP-glucose 6-dehydrogenase